MGTKAPHRAAEVSRRPAAFLRERSRRPRAARQRTLLLASAAALFVIAAPVSGFAATVVAAPAASPSPTCAPHPCVPAPQLTLTQTADKTSAAIGDTVTYTVTVGNIGSLPANAVTVDDAIGGSAGFLVEDGTGSTPDTFLGAPVTTITRVLTGHYRWTYATVSPGVNGVVRFSAVIEVPGTGVPGASPTISLTSTASTAGVPPATATTTAPLPASTGSGGAVKGTTTGVPGTGSGLYVAVAGVLFVGGVGLILLGVLARRRDEVAG